MGNDGNETPFVPTVPIVPIVLFVPAVRIVPIVPNVPFVSYRKNVPIVPFVSGVPESTPLSLAALTGVSPAPPRGEPSVRASIMANCAVRQSCEQVCLTTSWPPPTGVLLPPPVGEVAQDAQADCDGEGCLPRVRGRWPAGPERAKPPSFWTGAQGLHQGCAGAAGRLTAGCGTARRSPPRWCRGGCRDGRRRRKRSRPGRGCPPP